MRRLARAILLLWALATVAAAGWALSQHPFAAPMVARGDAELRAVYARAMARVATPGWLLPRLEAALAAQDADMVALLLEVAEDQAIALPPGTETAARALVIRADGWVADLSACAACAADLARCRTLSQIGTCALPVELTVLGDLNALRRASALALEGREVDGTEVGLALVGVAATGAVVVSGGGSYGVKLGATVLRLARRGGVAGAGLVRALDDAARGLVRWPELGPALARRAPLDSAVDGVRLARLGDASRDVLRIAQNTSGAEALVLLRHADSPADLARLARVTEAAGRDSRKVLTVLGGARSFRLMYRLGDAALLAAGLVTLALAQLAALAGAAAKLALSRALRVPRWQRRRQPPPLRRPAPLAAVAPRPGLRHHPAA